MNDEMVDVLILGSGLCGMAAASQLGQHATVLERAERPGGLVKSHRLGEWWFDEVLHLLYFWDDETARIVKNLMGDELESCSPEAFCVTPHGTTRYPFQMHLSGVSTDVACRCLRDLARVTFGSPSRIEARHFAEALEVSNGRGLCDAFLFPYNRKTWKRPLESLAPSGFQWNIPRPDFDEVLRGALEPVRSYATYNSNGYYPRPAVSSSVRGMEVLSRSLAEHVVDLRTAQDVLEVDLDLRTVRIRNQGQERVMGFRKACLSTIPLPLLLRKIPQAPDVLRAQLDRLTWNRVDMVFLAIEGPRPFGCGHWRYYSEPLIVFGRLVFTHRFDPLMAPLGGWGLMAEITERAETPSSEPDLLISRCEADARRCGVLGPEHRIVDACVHGVDPGYVVFTPDNLETMNACRAFLSERGVTPLGRFGRWEYSSMAQVMRDGFRWGRQLAESIGVEVAGDVRWGHAAVEEGPS
jgi:protoporphyrinogen oxidase